MSHEIGRRNGEVWRFEVDIFADAVYPKTGLVRDTYLVYADWKDDAIEIATAKFLEEHKELVDFNPVSGINALPTVHEAKPICKNVYHNHIEDLVT